MDIMQVMADSAFLLRSIQFHRSAPVPPMVMTREPKISNTHNSNIQFKLKEAKYGKRKKGKTCMFSALFKSRTKNASSLN